jgi:hypothetical protein
MSLVERLRAVENSGACIVTGVTTCWHRNPDGPEAAALIEQLVEALTYTRAALGDPVPIGKRHIARKIDAALSKASETQS